MKNRKPIIAVGALAVVGLVAGTIAYFQYTESFDNLFQLAQEKTSFEETFTSPTDWTPCTETPKVLEVKNNGTGPINVRVKITERWDKLTEDRSATTGQTLPLVVNNESMSVINFAHPNDWVLNENDGYYYYMSDIPVNGQSSSFIDKVTFNCNANNDYSSAQYHLILSLETISAEEAARQAEGWSFPTTNTPIEP